MFKRLVLLFALAFPTLASAQGIAFSGNAQRTIQNFLAPIPGALITFCSSAGTGTPCTPTAPIYSDSGLTQLIAGSAITADSNGNWIAYAPPGIYKYSITATGVTGQLFTTVLPAGLASNNTFSGSNTFTQQIVSTVTVGTAPFSIASPTLVTNLNAQFLGGNVAPNSAIVGVSDTQTLTAKTLTAPTITNPTITGGGSWSGGPSLTTPAVTGGSIDGVNFGHAAAQVSAVTNYGTALGTQTVVSSLPATGIVQIQFQIVQATLGVGCSASTNTVVVNLVSYTTPVGGTSLTFNPSASASITGNGAVDSGEPGTGTGAGFNDNTTFGAKGLTSISYTTTSTLGSTGCSTVPQYQIMAKLIY